MHQTLGKYYSWSSAEHFLNFTLIRTAELTWRFWQSVTWLCAEQRLPGLVSEVLAGRDPPPNFFRPLKLKHQIHEYFSTNFSRFTSINSTEKPGVLGTTSIFLEITKSVPVLVLRAACSRDASETETTETRWACTSLPTVGATCADSRSNATYANGRKLLQTQHELGPEAAGNARSRGTTWRRQRLLWRSRLRAAARRHCQRIRPRVGRSAI